MKIRTAIFLLLILGLILVSSPAWAKGWYLGGEFQLTSLGDKTVADIDAGYGFAVDFGYRFSPKFALDFLWGLSFHDEDGNDVEYMRFLGGGRLIFNNQERLQPYVNFGFEDNIIFRSLIDDIDGFGYYIGFGTNYFLSEKSALDIGLKHSMWTAETDIPSTSEDVTTDTLNVSYQYFFKR